MDNKAWQERERTAQRARDKLAGLLEEVTEHLTKITGQEWIVVSVDEYGFATLGNIGETTGPAYQGLHVQLDRRNAGRLIFDGMYPRTKKNEYAIYSNDNAPRISCAIERRPAAIALDIARRLLPEYRALLSKVAGRVKATDSARDARQEARERIAAAWGGRLHPNSDDEVIAWGDNRRDATIKVYAPDSITVDLSYLTAEQVINLAGWYKENVGKTRDK